MNIRKFIGKLARVNALATTFFTSYVGCQRMGWIMVDDASSGEPKTERFNMFMSPSEMKAIDEWAWATRIRSKSEVVRRLVQIGLRLERSTLQLNQGAQELTNALAELDLEISKAVSAHEGLSKSEALKKNA